MKIRPLRGYSYPDFSALTLTLLAALGASFCAPTLAQQASDELGQARDSRDRELTPVTVTARLSDEKPHDLPFTVNIISGEEVESRRLASMEDMLRATPGVEVNSWGGVNSANVRIRGVGSLNQGSGDDASVAASIDGAPTSIVNTTLGMLDVEQVEVLKGPQGTLFGRNSAAGAINIRARKPTRQFEASVHGEVGNDHQHLAEGILSGPLGETLSGRLALRHNARDYPADNTFTGKPVSRPRDLAWRGSLLWQPQAVTQVVLRASQHESRRHQDAMFPRPYGNHPAQGLSVANPLDGNYHKIRQIALEIRHDLPWARLTSVTSHERIDNHQINMTGREATRIWYGTEFDYPMLSGSWDKIWNQDLRLGSRPGSRIFWVAGINLYRGERGRIRSVQGRTTDNEHSHDADALYGEATWPLDSSAAFRLTTGLRYTRERKDYQGRYDSFGVRTSDARNLEESHTTGRLGLSWALTPQTNAYATLTRGHKAGGFSETAFSSQESVPYQAGRVNSLELGFKHDAADGALILNGALFFNKVRNDHLLAFDSATRSNWMVNADTESRGAELEARWRAGGGFTLSGGLSIIDARIKSHVLTNTPAGDVHDGNRVPDVPHFSALLAAQYQRALPAFWGLRSPALNARLSLRHVGKRSADPQNNFDLDSYDKLDLRAGIASGNSEVYVWGDNLLDERYDLYGYYGNPAQNLGMPSHGRGFGIGFAHYF